MLKVANHVPAAQSRIPLGIKDLRFGRFLKYKYDGSCASLRFPHTGANPAPGSALWRRQSGGRQRLQPVRVSPGPGSEPRIHASSDGWGFHCGPPSTCLPSTQLFPRTHTESGSRLISTESITFLSGTKQRTFPTAPKTGLLTV